jgi:hypothetical protein
MHPFGRNHSKEGLYFREYRKRLLISLLTDKGQTARAISEKCDISNVQVGQILTEACNEGRAQIVGKADAPGGRGERRNLYARLPSHVPLQSHAQRQPAVIGALSRSQ